MNLSSKFGWKSGKLSGTKQSNQSQEDNKNNKEIQLLNNQNRIDYPKKSDMLIK